MKDCEQVQSAEIELPPITIKSLPPLPPLYNPHPRRGPLIQYRVLGYAFTIEALAKWADKHQIKREQSNFNRRLVTLRVMAGRLPANWRRKAIVHDPRTGSLSSCIVIASNETPEELEMAQDMERICMFQKAVETTALPRWYRADLS